MSTEFPTEYWDSLKDRALGTLVTAFRTTSYGQAFAKAVGETFQTLEDAVYDELVSSRLSVASGERLDVWGQYVAEGRGDLSDAQYRRLIRAKVASNRSNARNEDIDAVIDALYDEPMDFRVERLWPHSIQIDVAVPDYTSEAFRRRFRPLIRTLVPGAHDVQLVEYLTDSGFQFSGSGLHVFDTGILADRVL